jgi:hypothetical protein
MVGPYLEAYALKDLAGDYYIHSPFIYIPPSYNSSSFVFLLPSSALIFLLPISVYPSPIPRTLNSYFAENRSCCCLADRSPFHPHLSVIPHQTPEMSTPCLFSVSSTRDENLSPLHPRGTSTALKLVALQQASIMIPTSSSSRTSSPEGTSKLKEYKFEPSHEVSPGIWSNKTVSSCHPHVQDLLKVARSQSYLHGNFNPIVYGLAALELFYKPYEQAHWLFWSTKKMQRTAEIVNSVYFHNPPLIQSKVKWIGIRESLNFLRNYRASWRSSYESAPWYYTHEPQEQPAPKMQLRDRSKRKRVQTYDFLSDAELDDARALQPPVKRPRVRRAPSSRKPITPRTPPQPLKVVEPEPVAPAQELPQSMPPPPPPSSSSFPRSPSSNPRTSLPNPDETLVAEENILSHFSDSVFMNDSSRSRTRSASQSSGDTAVSVSSGVHESRTRHRSLSTCSSVLTAVASTVDGKSECGEIDQDEHDAEGDASEGVAEASAEDEVEESSTPAVVRRSGRNKKTTSRGERAKAGGAPDPSAKRKRGRPRKNAV